MAAKERPVELADLDGSRSAKGDEGFSIHRVRCTHKTGRWIVGPLLLNGRFSWFGR
jgi:hypothetical protein